MIGRQLHSYRLTTLSSSSSRWIMRRPACSWRQPSANVVVACAIYPLQQQQCSHNVRWLATKRQKRAAAAANAAGSSGSGSSTSDENKPASVVVGGGDSTITATANDASGDDDDDKTINDDDDGRIFQSHDQIFAKRDAAAATAAAQQSPTVWLPPPLANNNNTKDLQEAFQLLQQQHDSLSSNKLHLSSLSSLSSSSSTSSTSSTTNLFEFQDHYRQMYNPDIHLASAPTNWTGAGYEAATPLWHDLAALIGVSGRPISVADYMRLCLTHPEYGYYTRANNNTAAAAATAVASSVDGGGKLDDFDHDDWDDKKKINNDTNDDDDNDGLIIGPSGDFVTAPEMTQIFGECLAVWFMTVWQQKQQQRQQRQSKTTALVANDTDSTGSVNNTTANEHDASSWQWLEFGPGTGTLMADFVRFCFHGSDKIRNTFGGSNCRAIHFIEQSPRLRQVQKRTLESVHNHAIIAPGEQEKAKRFVEFEFHDESDNNKKKKDVDGTLHKANDNNGIVQQRLPVYWHDSLAHFHAWQEKNQSFLPTHVVCQEFLDALPIYAFEKTAKEGWRERLVDIALREDMMESSVIATMDDDDDVSSVKEEDKDKSSISKTPQQQQQQSQHDAKATAATSRISTMKKPRLRIVLAPEVTPAARTLLGVQELKDGNDCIAVLPNEDPPAPVGSVIEVNPEAILLVQDLARLIDRQGGAAIIIDYGPEHGSRDSIRAFSRHEQVHFLSQPGLVDITADVDFAALKHAVNHLHDSTSTANDGNQIDKKTSATTCTTRAFGPVPQGNFLMAMGANDRAVQLIENDNTTEEEAENVYQALVRLCSPEEMGQRFKVMALLDPSTIENNINSSNNNSFQQPPGF